MDARASIEWKGPYEVYCEKLGLVTKPFDNPYAMIGRTLEPLIASMYETEFGVKLHKGNFTRHKKIKWLLSSPDYFVEGRQEGVDCKLVMSPRSAAREAFKLKAENGAGKET